jgi:hypothetical protein
MSSKGKASAAGTAQDRTSRPTATREEKQIIGRWTADAASTNKKPKIDSGLQGPDTSSQIDAYLAAPRVARPSSRAVQAENASFTLPTQMAREAAG